MKKNLTMENQNQGLQRTSKDTLPLVPISEAKDLLKAKPIAMQLKQVNELTILTEIRISLEKCAMGLGIGLTDFQAETICQDILELYRTDSVEDVQQCLKKGRQGIYGFAHYSRSSLSMPLISYWMSLHLEEKAQAREKELAQFKDVPEPIENVDYEAYKERTENEKKSSRSDSEYNHARASYFAERIKSAGNPSSEGDGVPSGSLRPGKD